jgi:hypothetical protein
MPPSVAQTGSRKVEPRTRKDSPSKHRRSESRNLTARLDEIYAMPVTTPAEFAAQHDALEAWKRNNAELCRVYGAANSQPAPHHPTPAASRVDRRPRERREQRHTARSTSSGDSGDPDSPGPGEAGLESRINHIGRERQTAWAGADPDATERLTSELDGLYEVLREQRRGSDGGPFAGRSASYVTTRGKAPRPWRVKR